jgi:hypothetical protein
VPRFKPMGPRPVEDTLSLLPLLAALYPDEVIAGILNRQGRKTAMGERFTANQVGSADTATFLASNRRRSRPAGNWFRCGKQRKFSA